MTHARPAARFAINAAANWVAFGFTAAVGFFLAPYMVNRLGAAQYGIWIVASSLLAYLGILDLGIRQGVNRYIANYLASGQDAASARLVSAALRLLMLLACVALVAASVLAWIAPTIFHFPAASVGAARVVILLGGVTVAASLGTGVYAGVLTGLERFDVSCALEIGVTALRAAGVVVVLRQGHGLVALAIVQVSASVVAWAAYRAAARALHRNLQVAWREPVSAETRVLLGFASSVVLIFAFSRVLACSDALIVAAYRSAEDVTFYAVAASLVLYAKEVPRALAYLITPRAGALAGRNSPSLAQEVLAVSRVTILASAALASFLLVRGESLIGLWMGPSFARVSGGVLEILAFMVWVDGARSVIAHTLMGVARQASIIPGFALEAAASIALAAWAVNGAGLVGVALAFTIPSAILMTTYFPRRLAQATGIAPLQFLRSAVLLPTLACLPYGLTMVALEHYAPAANLGTLFVQAAAAAPLIVLGGWALCLQPAERLQATLGFQAWRAH